MGLNQRRAQQSHQNKQDQDAASSLDLSHPAAQQKSQPGSHGGQRPSKGYGGQGEQIGVGAGGVHAPELGGPVAKLVAVTPNPVSDKEPIVGLGRDQKFGENTIAPG